jgi:H+/Cl- antiporter ClcA
MAFSWNPREHVALGAYVVRWVFIGGISAVVIGSACAGFLWLLDVVTTARLIHPALLFALPVAGVGIGLLYHWLGRSVEGGNNLIMEEIHEPGGGVPGRMAPLVLTGTVVTHLFGGSAGREGTAVQMGGSIASSIGRWLHLDNDDARTLMMAGVAAGFGAVFGTPLTGAVFAMEVLAVGRMSYEAIVPCLIASIVGDWTCGMWGLRHTQYHIAAFSEMGLVHQVARLDWVLAGKVAVAAAAFGLASVLFAELTHSLHRFFKWAVPSWPSLAPLSAVFS